MPITRFLDPKNDFAFKQVFGTEKNKDILIHFLNDILWFNSPVAIRDVTFLKTNQDPEIAEHTDSSVVDVLCVDHHDMYMVVKMHMDGRYEVFGNNTSIYTSQAYFETVSRAWQEAASDQIKTPLHNRFKGAIFLGVVDFVLFPEKEGWQSDHLLLDTKTYENDLKDCRFHFMELKKFNKKIHELTNIREKWAYFFRHAHQSTIAEMSDLIGEDRIIKRAFEAVDQASWSEVELRTYEQVTKIRLDNRAVEEQKIWDAEDRGDGSDGEGIRSTPIVTHIPTNNVLL